jgi:hypothetical protein
MYAIPVVHQNDMSPDYNVTVAARGRAQVAGKVTWRRAAEPPHIRIEHVTGLKPRLVVVIPLIPLKPLLVLMLVIILTCSLALIVIELAIMLLGLAAILTPVAATLVVPVLSAVLRQCKTASQSKQNCPTSGNPPSSLHKFFSNRDETSFLRS